jgi:hypothetical protein
MPKIAYVGGITRSGSSATGMKGEIGEATKTVSKRRPKPMPIAASVAAMS